MSHRILLVEADNALCTLFHDILSDEGYEVMTATMPVLEPARVADLRLDAILLDYSVGRQAQARRVLHELHSSPSTTSIPIIISTTAAKPVEELAGLLRPNRDTLLPKPFALDDLLLTVKDAVTGSVA